MIDTLSLDLHQAAIEVIIAFKRVVIYTPFDFHGALVFGHFVLLFMKLDGVCPDICKSVLWLCSSAHFDAQIID